MLALTLQMQTACPTTAVWLEERLDMIGSGSMYAAECSPDGVVALCQSHMMCPAVSCVCTARQQQNIPASGPLHQVAQQLQNKLFK